MKNQAERIEIIGWQSVEPKHGKDRFFVVWTEYDEGLLLPHTDGQYTDIEFSLHLCRSVEHAEDDTRLPVDLAIEVLRCNIDGLLRDYPICSYLGGDAVTCATLSLAAADLALRYDDRSMHMAIDQFKFIEARDGDDTSDELDENLASNRLSALRRKMTALQDAARLTGQAKVEPGAGA